MTAIVIDPSPYPPKGWLSITEAWFDSDMYLCRRNRRPQINPDCEGVLLKPLSVSYRLDQGDLKRLTVPEKFITDGTSIPDRLKGLMKKMGITQWGLGLEASVVHDYLYIAWQFLKEESQRKPKKSDKTFADHLFYKLLLQCKVEEDTAETMRWTSSACGWDVYRTENPNTWYCGELYPPPDHQPRE